MAVRMIGLIPLVLNKEFQLSHVVVIKTEVRDPAAVSAACRRLQLAEPTFGAARLFTQEATGWIVQLHDWRYPVVCQTDSGQVLFDDFQGRWGDPAHLDRFLQSYAVEKTRLEARRQGYDIFEQPLSDGSIKLTLLAGGVA